MNEQRPPTDWDAVRANLLDASNELENHTEPSLFAEFRDNVEYERAMEVIAEAAASANVSPEFWRKLSVAAYNLGDERRLLEYLQRYLVLMAPAMAAYEKEKDRFSDYVGRPGNADNDWFDTMVEEWKMEDGSRLHSFEVSQLGRQLVRWVLASHADIVQAVFVAIEDALSGPDFTQTTSRDQTLELLDSLLAEILEHERLEPNCRETLEPSLRRLMGDETKLLWIPFLASARDAGWTA